MLYPASQQRGSTLSSKRQGPGAPCTHSLVRPSRGPGQRRAPSGAQSQGLGQRDPGSCQGCSGDGFSIRIASACSSLSAGARCPMARQPPAECELLTGPISWTAWGLTTTSARPSACLPSCRPPPAPALPSHPASGESLLSLTWDSGQLPHRCFPTTRPLH